LVDIFGGLLDRPIIKSIFDPYYPRLVIAMDEELDSAKMIYDWQMNKLATDGVPPVHKNFPKVGRQYDCRSICIGLVVEFCLT